MVDVARQRHNRPNITYRNADLFDIDGRYDCVFSSAALHHVEELDAALAHLRSLVAPGGRVVLVDVVRPGGTLSGLPVRMAPRVMYRAGALISLMREIATRRPGAWSAFRLRTFGPWLDHLATDRFLTPGEFDAAYGRHFPGATFVELDHLRACLWQD
jgi:SAM-dependent methyltransferase